MYVFIELIRMKNEIDELNSKDSIFELARFQSEVEDVVDYKLISEKYLGKEFLYKGEIVRCIQVVHNNKNCTNTNCNDYIYASIPRFGIYIKYHNGVVRAMSYEEAKEYLKPNAQGGGLLRDGGTKVQVKVPEQIVEFYIDADGTDRWSTVEYLVSNELGFEVEFDILKLNIIEENK